MRVQMPTHSHSYSLLTTLCQGRGILSAFIVAQSLALIISFSIDDSSAFWLTLGQVSLLAQFITSLSIALLYLLSRTKLTLSNLTQLICVVCVLVCTTFITASYTAYLGDFGASYGTWFVLKSCAISLVVAALFAQFMAIYNEHANTHSAFAKAQLDALQARIKPHFLFNTLNTVAELAHQDADAAEDAALALASLSRAALHAGEDSTLEQEIALAKRYILLEQWRFGERLHLDWQLPESIPNTAMPCLTLQPLLENAVYYSMQGEKGDSTIKVELVETQKTVTVVVQNHINETSIESKQGNGIALGNIAQRLQLKFGDAAQLHTRKLANEFRVKLVIPRGRVL
ncbi:sensor histidine kinase [Pseudoalteromonas pernae]|uniref:sensor histidine kinase n=1 Tax=Pseudoalteromonas pernae TaxID=3118054 RepID=UPI0032427B05